MIFDHQTCYKNAGEKYGQGTGPLYLGVSMLAGLGSGHLYNFAGTSLHDHVSTLAQSRALNGIGVGGSGLCRLEVNNICHGVSGKGAEKQASGGNVTSFYM